MSHRIACFTLFDITKTGILNRARPGDDIEDVNAWYRKRNTQSNFDTIVQVISLRAQPDIVTDPKKLYTKFDHLKFGYTYKESNEVPYWSFDFEVQHPSVFEDGLEDLGHLYRDSHSVPMIGSDTTYYKIGNILDTAKETRNIYFVKY